jgi:hypothetical protein
MQKMQIVNNAQSASCKQCAVCKFKTMQRPQIINNPAAAQYADAVMSV